jgi:hypothetical protein
VPAEQLLQQVLIHGNGSQAGNARVQSGALIAPALPRRALPQDTPEFFWQAPDSMQSVYDKVWEYLEMEDRIEVINTRLSVLHEMLDMLRNQQNALHSERVELIIIWLIVADCVILLFQLSASLGWVGKGSGKGPGDLLGFLGWGW